MKNQVLSIDQCKELVALGLDMSNASLHWYASDECEAVCFGTDIDNDWGEEVCATFTLQDILSILKPLKCCLCFDDGWFVEIWNNKTNLLEYCTEGYENPLEAAFNMLKWCKQNKEI